METKKCTRCRKEKPIELFQKNGKILGNCLPCREYKAKRDRERKKDPVQKAKILEQKRKWAEKNKKHISDYNKHYKDVQVGNNSDWDKIKKDNGHSTGPLGKQSKTRKQHVTKDGVEGKHCSKCKDWHPLDNYNYSSKSWDELRTTCKTCLGEYRADEDNKQKFRDYMREYETNRRRTDPMFKLKGNLRGRLWTALSRQGVKKTNRTFDLVGCTYQELYDHLEEQFTDGMTWDNYGDWHVDHIIPCASWDLSQDKEQKLCFHYTNLQPLWGEENNSKNDNFCEKEKEQYIETTEKLI